VLIDEGVDGFDEHGVLEDEEMGVEDAGVVSVEGLADLVLDVEDLPARFQEGLLEAVDLGGEVLDGDVVSGDVGLGFMKDKDFALANAGGNGDALKDPLSRFRFFCHKQYLMPLTKVEKAIWETLL
jgi:hypothetical protein